jgi:hypothetical protein
LDTPAQVRVSTQNRWLLYFFTLTVLLKSVLLDAHTETQIYIGNVLQNVITHYTSWLYPWLHHLCFQHILHQPLVSRLHNINTCVVFFSSKCLLNNVIHLSCVFISILCVTASSVIGPPAVQSACSSTRNEQRCTSTLSDTKKLHCYNTSIYNELIKSYTAFASIILPTECDSGTTQKLTFGVNTTIELNKMTSDNNGTLVS